MRAVEVYDNLKNYDGWDWASYRMVKAEAEVCKAALLKQIPKKPAQHQGGYICPNDDCIGILTDKDWRADYCPDCGQRIKWDD